MSERPSIDSTLSLARDYIDRLNGSIQDEFEGKHSSGKIKGIVCKLGSHSYFVMASDGWEWVRLRYPFNIDQVYAIRELNDEKKMKGVKITNEEIEQARSEFDSRLDRVPLEERQEFRMNLIHMLAEGTIELDLDVKKDVNIHGFNVDSKLFIHEDNFSLSDFHTGVQTIINKGWRGREFMLDNYGLRKPTAENNESAQQQQFEDYY